MAVSNEDVGSVVLICARHRERVCFGVLGAALSKRVGNPDAQPRHFGMAAGAMVRAFFGEPTPVASWVVGVGGYPPRDPTTGYGNPPNEKYDRAWSTLTPLHIDVEEFLEWLDSVSPGWDANLQSTYRENDLSNEVAGRAEDPGKESSEVTARSPNLRALAILKEVHERQRGRLSSQSGRTQDYLREARSGGMYGYDDSFDE